MPNPSLVARENKKANEYTLSINAATDAKNMPFTEWEKVWGKNKTLFPEGYEGRDSYKYFKDIDPKFFQGRLENIHKQWLIFT